MSWSVAAFGKPEAVAKKLKEEFEKITYLEGAEATAKEKIGEVVQVILADLKGVSVKVSASGSASHYKSGEQDIGQHSVSLSIESLFGFVE